MRVALITGASRGIGRQLARSLARTYSDLILVARHRSDLDCLASELRAKHGVNVHVWPEDLSEHEAPPRIERRLVESGLPLHLLVNNAGVGTSGPFVERDPLTELATIQLNVYALTALSRLLLPHLIANRGTGILNVASTAALQPVPMMATYAATKAYVLSFSQALDGELAGTGLTVSALCPGPTQTDFVQSSGAQNTRLFRSSGLATVEHVADAALRGIQRRQVVIIPGFKNRLLAFAARFLPRAALVKISRSLMLRAA